MNLDSLTPEIFNTLIIINIAVGVSLAVWRFRRDMTRPLDEFDEVYQVDRADAAYGTRLEDTQPSDRHRINNMTDTALTRSQSDQQ